MILYEMLFFFLTPMYFVARDATGLLGKIIWFNPFTYYIESFHQMLYYGVMPDMHYVMVCAILPIFSSTYSLIAGVIATLRPFTVRRINCPPKKY